MGTPSEVLAERRRLTLGRDADGLADLFAVDAVVEAPFAPAGAPSRLVGREAVREYARQMMTAPFRLEEYKIASLYETPDPEVVIVEMETEATLTATGQSFVTTSVQILRIRDGEIVLFRDFANPNVLDAVIGTAGHHVD